jgi:hypothetical protein
MPAARVLLTLLQICVPQGGCERAKHLDHDVHSRAQPRNYARNTTGGGRRRNIGPFAGYAGCGAGERSEADRLHAVDLGCLAPPHFRISAARGGRQRPPQRTGLDLYYRTAS